MTAYYNENDKKAAQWLRNLIAAGHIAPGDVDDRSLEDVKPSDLIGYTQCHFFAGIGIWSDSLRRAGWPDERPVWTGSCPCQPFSAAGKGLGIADERHLWPAWEWLIRHAKPRSVPVFGEQVASKDGLAWLDVVQADLEGQGYTVRALDLCAAGVGAPHIRQRLYFVADANGRDASAEGLQRSGQHGQQPEDGRVGGLEHATSDGRIERRAEPSGRGAELRCCESRLADTKRHATKPRRTSVESAKGTGTQSTGSSTESGRRSVPSVLGVTASSGCERIWDQPTHGVAVQADPVNSFWHDADWLPCIDGKARPVEPGSFPLAHGIAGRVGRLRAYGNAIVAPLAEEFIRAYLG